VGILSALTPTRTKFGFSVAAIGVIAILFMCMYACWYDVQWHLSLITVMAMTDSLLLLGLLYV
jgi:hypothetical protein